MLVDVALPVPVHRTFTYRVPVAESGRVQPGIRVLVSFRGKERIGWINRVVEQSQVKTVRDITRVLEDTPSAPAEILELCRWIAEYYIAPLGQVLRAALPASLSETATDHISLTDPTALPEELSELEERIVAWLRENERPRAVSRLRRELGDRAWWPAIRRLETAGAVTVQTEAPREEPAVKTRRVLLLKREIHSLTERDELFGRARRQAECWDIVESMGGSAEVGHLTQQLGFSQSVINGLVSKGLAEVVDQVISRDPYAAVLAVVAPALRPTAAQAGVIRALIADARREEPGTFLLRGVTGSGKTLVYVELLREIVHNQGRGAIVLVPEIALTPQTVGRFRAAFGDQVAVLHSALSDGERYDEWQALRKGDKRIAVGARSAIFAPVANLGAIVVDEEHEGTYKQAEAPRYHAREVAVVRGRLEGAICLLGSATPSLESWANAGSSKYNLLELPSRIGDQGLPPIRVVDLRAERKRQRELKQQGETVPNSVLSESLKEAIADRLRKHEQIILLLNRRGYANFVQCRECGHVWHCPQCNVSLTYHRATARLTCHYCLHEEASPARCSACGSADLTFRGIGTEQVERTVGDLFPAARIARMDVDTTSAKWAHHDILGRVERHEIDILLGTQMIAKGLDFPNVTLVGVVNADTGINLPDFRASERTFQLLTQVAGRAGRGAKGGEVIVQTSLPDHYVVTCALEHDFIGFAAREMEARRHPAYPPLCRLVNVVVSGLGEDATQRGAEAAYAWFDGLLKSRRIRGIELVGPAPCPIDRIRGRWRWHFLIRSENSTLLGQTTRYFAERFTAPSGKDDLRVAIDRDPVALL